MLLEPKVSVQHTFYNQPLRTTEVWPGHISLRPRTISRLRVVDPARRGSSLGSLATSATSAEWRRTLSAETRRHFPVFLVDLAPRLLPRQARATPEDFPLLTTRRPLN